MNAITRPGTILGALIGEPSFADVIEATDKADDLTPAQKSHWSTSLRQMGRYLGRPLSQIPASIQAIAAAVKALHAGRLGVNPKTFANHRANARTALLWFNKQTPYRGRKAPMASNYRVLLARIADRYAKEMLSPFFRFVSAKGIQPDAITDRLTQAFQDYRRETSFAKIKPFHHRALVRHWNNCAAQIDGWPQIKLTEPPYAKRSSGPAWEDFPQGLRKDIDAECERLGKRHTTNSGKIVRPCKKSTIDMRRREIIAAVRVAVGAGTNLEELDSLPHLLHPDRVDAIIDKYWQENGERPSLYTIDLGYKFLALARSVALSNEQIARLDEIRVLLEQYRSTGLTEKNRKFIRQVAHSDVWRDVVRLPTKLMADAKQRSQTKPVKAAVTAQLAIAILILIWAPIRMQNLASIRIGINLIRPRGLGTPYMLVFPDYDVKNNVPLEFEFDEQTTALIDEYITEHRPQLMRGLNHDCLFPGDGKEMKCTKTLSEQISERLWKELGLKITPHQFRHAAAYLMLKADPGNYELVRRVLGHRSIATTQNFYIGLETLEATRLFGSMVTKLVRGERPGGAHP
jgi:integrase